MYSTICSVASAQTWGTFDVTKKAKKMLWTTPESLEVMLVFSPDRSDPVTYNRAPLPCWETARIADLAKGLGRLLGTERIYMWLVPTYESYPDTLLAVVHKPWQESRSR